MPRACLMWTRRVLTAVKCCSECIVEFEDNNYSRDSVYYVRAIQEATPAINGSQPTFINNEFSICKGSFRTALDDNCLSLVNERAWSSPVYLNKP